MNCVVTYSAKNGIHNSLYFLPSLTAWEGDLCQLDVDGCATLFCFPGVDCVDVPGPGVGANCSDCPIGFLGDGSECISTQVMVSTSSF